MNNMQFVKFYKPYSLLNDLFLFLKIFIKKEKSLIYANNR